MIVISTGGPEKEGGRERGMGGREGGKEGVHTQQGVKQHQLR